MNPSVLSGVLLTVLLHGSLVAGLVAFSNLMSDDEGRPPLQMISIEAALATKGEESNQIRKKSRKARPRPEPKAIKPTDDATKVEEDTEEQPQPPEPQEDFTDDFQKYMKQYEGNEDSEDDFDPEAADEGKGGQFDGSEHGFAEVSKGDPYMQKLAADIFASWEVPTLEKGEGMAVGCVRLAPDGSIVESELWKPTKNANIDRSVELALDRLQKLRKPNDAPVPVHLMDATKRWTCFNFPVNAK